MPDEIAGGYDAVGDMWVSSEDSDTEIKAGCGVRLRIIGVTVGAELVRKFEHSPVFSGRAGLVSGPGEGGLVL